ncbi:MAG: LamG-like jellyroll fold domain-containing protein [Pseudomonadota bacterium]
MTMLLNPYRFDYGQASGLNPSDPANIYIQHDLQNPADASQDRNAWATNGTNTGASVDTARTLFGLPTTHFNLSNYIRVPSIDFNALVASDFVMEAWVYANTRGSIMTVYQDRRQFTFRVGFAWIFTQENSFTNFFEFGSGAAATLNMWQHHAWQRRVGTGGAPDTHAFFIDGVRTATATTTKRWRSTSMSTSGGTDFTLSRTGRGGSNGYAFEGNMAQARFPTEAFYPSGGFTPPAGPFPTS